MILIKYPLRHPQQHLIETRGLLIEVHGRGSRYGSVTMESLVKGGAGAVVINLRLLP